MKHTVLMRSKALLLQYQQHQARMLCYQHFDAPFSTACDVLWSWIMGAVQYNLLPPRSRDTLQT
jgi:hypothetical protein